tara:strand:+ start:510 stop:1118 length:609 start_codon:yes stop_codon:yes gene_type:complete
MENISRIIKDRAIKKDLKYSHQDLTRVVKNRSQFKGNQLTIQSCEDYISVFNTYWNSVVHQMYSIKEDKTFIEFRIDTPPVKWLSDKFKSFKTLTSSVTVIGAEQIDDLPKQLKITDINRIKLYFLDYGATHITLYMESKGCTFINNGDAIDILKTVRRTQRIIKDKFKVLSERELIDIIDEIHFHDHTKQVENQIILNKLL